MGGGGKKSKRKKRKKKNKGDQRMAKGKKSNLMDLLTNIFDRRNEQTRILQDLAINVALFGLAVYTMHRYGHKLAV